MIAILIGYEAVTRLFEPVPIHFAEAIPIACLGLAVNIVSACTACSGGHHHHDHSHWHSGDHGATQCRDEGGGSKHVPARWSWKCSRTGCRRASDCAARAGGCLPHSRQPSRLCVLIGARQLFAMVDRGAYLELIDDIPEPHAFTPHLRIGDEEQFTDSRSTRTQAHPATITCGPLWST